MYGKPGTGFWFRVSGFGFRVSGCYRKSNTRRDTENAKHETRNPKPETRNTKPETRNSILRHSRHIRLPHQPGFRGNFKLVLRFFRRIADNHGQLSQLGRSTKYPGIVFPGKI